MVLRDVADAEGYVASICFKTGPPRRLGVELEWVVHRAQSPTARLDAATLATALGPYAPAGLAPGSPPAGAALPGGGRVTVEPGGQVEISSAPADSLAELVQRTHRDVRVLRELLAGSGLVLGDSGIDAHRTPHRLVRSPRYAAMERAFDAAGPHGRTMMCSTAGLQVCLDAGTPDAVSTRWAAVHEVGPALLALFATASHHAGRPAGWASARMAAWFGIDRQRTRPVGVTADPAAAWARYALAAPLLCVRRAGDSWDAPPGVTFADWVRGALPHPPTRDDLDYHLGTLFPPVRPRGYLEVRYLDAQPGDEWVAPLAVLATLFADDDTVDAARDAAAPAAHRWLPAARDGLADAAVAAAAAALADLACRNLERTDLPAAARDAVVETVYRRLHHRPRAEPR